MSPRTSAIGSDWRYLSLLGDTFVPGPHLGAFWVRLLAVHQRATRRREMVSLEDLLGTVDEAVPPDGGPVWVRVDSYRHDELSVGLRDDVDCLLGWRAPSSCVAVGVISGGWAQQFAPAPGGTPRARCHGSPLRVRIGFLMDREGRTVGRTGFDDGRRLDKPPTSGRLVDALQRCLGLATEAPTTSAAPFLDALWLSEVICAAHDRRRLLRWSEVVALHPAMRVVAQAGEYLGSQHFAIVKRVANQAWTWEELRHQAAGGGWLEELIRPELAAWMDEGIFSRWLLDVVRPATELVTQLPGLVTDTTVGRVRESIAA